MRLGPTRFSTRLWGLRGCCLGLLMMAAVTAFAGPPFQTDDPDPVAFRHFEMYAFELSDSTTAGGTALEVPSYEVNYGVVPNVQLHLVMPFVTSIPPDNGPVYHGFGDTELGLKLRFREGVEAAARGGDISVCRVPERECGQGARGGHDVVQDAALDTEDLGAMDELWRRRRDGSDAGGV